MINTQTDQVVGPPIMVGTEPSAIAITPDGQTAYVANADSNNVSVIDTQTNQVVGPPITVGTNRARSRSPPMARGLRHQLHLRNVSVIDTQTNQVVGRRSGARNPSGRDRDYPRPTTTRLLFWSRQSRSSGGAGHLQRLGLQRPRRLDREL